MNGEGDAAPRESRVIRLGGWILDPAARRLSRAGVVHRLEPKMVDVLLLLVQRRGQVVERRAIERSVWSEAAVGSDVLNRTIWKLRQALEDDAADPQYIETIPRKGYRLVGAVEEAVVPGPARGRPAECTRGKHPLPIANVKGALAAALLLTVLLVLWRSAGTEVAGGREGPVSSPLTSAPGYEANPSVSPQGRYVAFQRYDPDASPPSWDVAVMDLESLEAFGLASEPGVHEYAPTWSPAGDSVAFVRSGERCQIVIQSLDGPPLEVAFCDVGQSHELAWLADGDFVLASSAPGQTLGLERVRRSSGDRDRLTTPPAGFDGDWMPRISPDGGRLAFVRRRTQGIADIRVLDLSPAPGDNRSRAITSDHRLIRGLGWDPSGASLLFTSRRGGGTRVWRVPVHGGTPEPVPLPGTNAGPLAAAHGLLVYEEYRGDSDLWVYDPRTNRAEPWHGSSRSEWGATVSPHGRTVAFVSDRTGGDEIWVVPVGGGGPRRLTTLDGAELDGPQWLPDGRRLVFASAMDGNFDVFTVDVMSGSLERVTHSEDDEREPTWWNGAIVYSANRTGVRELWRLGVDPGSDRRLTSGGGWVARPSPSGAELLFTRPGQEGVWLLDEPAGQPVRVRGRMGADGATNWCPTDGGILYLRSVGGTQTELVLLDAASGTESVLTRIPYEVSPRAGVTQLPDGRVLFGVITRSESDLWIAR
ncbi:MAG: winged helix-turn-helix domain-containing protein [Gemmatimonadota bacterium]